MSFAMNPRNNLKSYASKFLSFASMFSALFLTRKRSGRKTKQRQNLAPKQVAGSGLGAAFELRWSFTSDGRAVGFGGDPIRIVYLAKC